MLYNVIYSFATLVFLGLFHDLYGRGIITTEKRSKGDFLLKYAGDLISKEEGERRERKRPTGFRFFYDKLCIDASQETERLGRLVNHSKKNQNSKMVKKEGLLYLYALRDINIGEEITYDYGVNVSFNVQGLAGKDGLPSQPSEGQPSNNGPPQQAYITDPPIERGPLEEIGFKRPEGDTEPQGYSGNSESAGAQEPQGRMRADGSPCALGETGSQGPAGATGAPGPPGQQGPRGNTEFVAGAPRKAGFSEPQGPSGVNGLLGERGAHGYHGNQEKGGPARESRPQWCTVSLEDLSFTGLLRPVAKQGHLSLQNQGLAGKDGLPSQPSEGQPSNNGPPQQAYITDPPIEPGPSEEIGFERPKGDSEPQGYSGNSESAGALGPQGLAGKDGLPSQHSERQPSNNDPPGQADITAPPIEPGPSEEIDFKRPKGDTEPQGYSGNSESAGAQGPQGLAGKDGLPSQHSERQPSNNDPPGQADITAPPIEPGPSEEIDFKRPKGDTEPQGYSGNSESAGAHGPQEPQGPSDVNELSGEIGAHGYPGNPGEAGPARESRTRRKVQKRGKELILEEEAEDDDEDEEEDFDDDNDPDYHFDEEREEEEEEDDYDDDIKYDEEDEVSEIDQEESVVENSVEEDIGLNDNEKYLALSKTINYQSLSRKNEKGTRENKKHNCLYCYKLYPNIARHLERKHKDEIDVAKVLILPKKSYERRKACEKIVNEGDFAHNYNVLEKGDGQIIPKYRCSNQEKSIKLIPCTVCHGMYRKNELWRHFKKCSSSLNSKDNEKINIGPVAGGKKLMPKCCSSEIFHVNIIDKMRDDSIKAAVLSDPSIIKIGMNMYADHGNQNHRHVYISNKMREMGRLLIELKKNGISSISQAIDRANWDILVSSVRSLCQFEEETDKYGIPSLACKLGHTLKSMAEDLAFEKLKSGDLRAQEEAETFLKLYQRGWSSAVSAKAVRTLRMNKYNKPKLLPLVEDVVKVSKYIEHL